MRAGTAGWATSGATSRRGSHGWRRRRRRRPRRRRQRRPNEGWCELGRDQSLHLLTFSRQWSPMRSLSVLLACIGAICLGSRAFAHDYFKITVVDEQTKRGVPLVELRTTNEVRYYTDSNGVVAFLEPGLMDQNVFFTIKSHG